MAAQRRADAFKVLVQSVVSGLHGCFHICALLRVRLGEDFKLTTYDGGVMIQAGPRPQIGDATADRWPRHHVTLAQVLRPIQIKTHYPFHTGDPLGREARLDGPARLAWLFRFDGK